MPAGVIPVALLTLPPGSHLQSRENKAVFRGIYFKEAIPASLIRSILSALRLPIPPISQDETWESNPHEWTVALTGLSYMELNHRRI